LEVKKLIYRDEAKLIYDDLKGASEYLAKRLLSKIERYPDEFYIKGK
jgi:hypothetical protein